MSTDEATVEQTEAVKKLAEIIQRNRMGVELHAVYLERQEKAKAAKKRWEAHQEATQRFIADLDREYPLFEKPAAGPAPADDWREVRLDTLGLSESTLKHLAEAGLHTVGCVSDWGETYKDLTDVPGIGPAGSEAICTALDSFWAGRERDEVTGVTLTADGESVTMSPDELCAAIREAGAELAAGGDAGPVIDTDLERVLAAESEADAAGQGPAVEDLCEACGQVWTDCQCDDDDIPPEMVAFAKSLATTVEPAASDDQGVVPAPLQRWEVRRRGPRDQWASVGAVDAASLPEALEAALVIFPEVPRADLAAVPAPAKPKRKGKPAAGRYVVLHRKTPNHIIQIGDIEAMDDDHAKAVAKGRFIDVPSSQLEVRRYTGKPPKANRKPQPVPTPGVDGLFIIRINGGKPDHAVRAADLLSAHYYANRIEGKVTVKPDDGTVARLGLRIVEYLARDQVGCNKCHKIRPAAAAKCPACGCPEYHRSPLDVEAEAAAKPRKAKGKAVAS